MTHAFHRRRFLKVTAAVAALPLTTRVAIAAAGAPPGSPSVEEERGLTVYELGPQIWIRYNNRLLTCYRAHRSQKYPYLFPLSGPLSGLSLTDETTLPYPHHRSLFFGCDRVNGGNYWQEGYETGQILSTGPKVAKASKDSVIIADTCRWQKPGGPVIIEDERKISVSVPSDGVRFIEWVITLKALEPITVQKTNHSLFSMRAALDITPKGGGHLVNAEGKAGEKATAGVKSAWCDFYGQRAGMPNVTEGIAIFDHPRNPWAPTQWFTRDYGFASPTPLNWIDKPWTIAAGDSVAFRYAVVLHTGDPAAAKLPSLYDEWAARPA
jgi:hypothetical protein